MNAYTNLDPTPNSPPPSRCAKHHQVRQRLRVIGIRKHTSLLQMIPERPHLSNCRVSQVNDGDYRGNGCWGDSMRKVGAEWEDQAETSLIEGNAIGMERLVQVFRKSRKSYTYILSYRRLGSTDVISAWMLCDRAASLYT